MAAGILSLWYLTHPYNGIVHDSVVYVGRSLANLHPSTIGTQLSFVRDGQSKFSLFPVLMTMAIQAFGPGTAALLTTALGLGLWLAAAAFLFSRFLKGGLLVAALLCLCAMPSGYGGDSVFHWAETFATPRIFAEAASLSAIGLLLDRRLLACFLFLTLGLFLHPIMALPAIGLVLLLLCMQDRRWIFALALFAVALLTATLLHLPLADRLLLFPDADWVRVIDEVTPFLFLTHWQTGDWSILACQIGTAIFVIVLDHGWGRRLAAATLVMAVGGLLIAAAFPSLLVLQAQVWRSTWLLSVIVIGLMPLLAGILWRRGLAGRLAAVFVLLTWAWPNTFAAVLPLLAVAAVLASLKSGLVLPRLVLVGAWASAIVSILAFLAVRIGTFGWVFHSLPPDAVLSLPSLLYLQIHFFVALALALALAAGWVPKGLAGRPYLTLGFSSAMVLFAALFWDSRTGFVRWQEAGVGSVSRPLLNAGHVEWLDEHGDSWLITGRPEWWGHIQGAGVIFDRNLAVEWDRRYHRLLDARLIRPIDASKATIPQAGAIVTKLRIRQICVNGPDWIVARLAQTDPDAAAAGQIWRVPADEYVLNEKGDRWIAVRDYVIFNCARSVS